MTIIVYGTTGELIKLAPVVRRLRDRGAVLETWCTGQQAGELSEMTDVLGVPQPDLFIAEGFRGRPLSRKRHLPSWVLTLAARFTLRHYRSTKHRLAASNEPNLLIVHGDTFTTVVGAIFGRLLGVPVAHIEAGMRSHDWRNPFPEELNRRATARLADIHFAPGQVPVENLRGARGEVVDTVMNTVRDSLDLVPDTVTGLPIELPDRFGVVSLHRFELLHDREMFTQTLKVLAARATAGVPLLFVDHAVTAHRIGEYGLDEVFDGTTFVRMPKLSYLSFIAIVRRSEFVVTDSGGLQQESYYLDHPCLVHRAVTESSEGLGRNVVLSRLDLSVLEDFLDDPSRFRMGRPPEGPSPSDLIVDDLAARGFCPRPHEERVTD